MSAAPGAPKGPAALAPGSTIGFIGGGQLGRMMALEARRMGFRVAILDPAPQAAAAPVADVHVRAALDDVEGLRALAKASDVITYETEHVPVAALRAALPSEAPLWPSLDVLAHIQDRLAQRRFLESLALPQTAYAEVHDAESLAVARSRLPGPGVLKRREGGYDGLGQARLAEASGLEDAWQKLGASPCVLEALVPFVRELSIALGRDAEGHIRAYPIVENVHRSGILHTTVAPAEVNADTAERALAIARTLADAFAYVGLLTVELFELADGRLLINEVAPRVHNSGHFTWGASATSQFEQHLRAIAGWPLGDTTTYVPAVMLNLLGDLWQAGEPRFAELCREDGVRLHLYGKSPARKGRKMGHLLVLDADRGRALAKAERLHAELSRAAGLPERG